MGEQLSEQELAGLIEQARSETKESEDAYAALLRQYDPLLKSMAVKYGSDLPESDREDLLQEETVVFCNAVRSFDVQQREVTFGLYARICINNAVVSFLRKHTAGQHEVEPLDNQAEMGDISDEAGNPQKAVAEKESYRALQKTITENLSDYENRIWWLYASGKTATEVARIVGHDRKSVENAIFRIRKKLRRLLKE